MSNERVNLDFSDVPGIPQDALDKLSSVDVDIYGSRRAVFEPWQDEVIKRLWPVARKSDVAEIVGFSEGTIRRRWQELQK